MQSIFSAPKFAPMTVRTALLAAASSALLGACGREGAGTGATDNASAEAPAAAIAETSGAAAIGVATTAAGAPKRAAGNWELKHFGGGGTVIGTQFLCVDQASEEKASVFDQIAKNVNCSRYETTRIENGWNFDFICGSGGMVAMTSGSANGDFADSYRVEMTQSDGSMTLERIIEANRLGDCPAGVAPGTLSDEEGRTVADITQ